MKFIIATHRFNRDSAVVHNGPTKFQDTIILPKDTKWPPKVGTLFAYIYIIEKKKILSIKLIILGDQINTIALYGSIYIYINRPLTS